MRRINIWTRDGRAIYYTANAEHPGKYETWRVDVASGKVTKLVGDGHVREPKLSAAVGGDYRIVFGRDTLPDVAYDDERGHPRLRMRHAPFAIGPVELKVEASIGVAIYPLDSRDAKGLLAVADAAMYAGKTSLTQVA